MKSFLRILRTTTAAVATLWSDRAHRRPRPVAILGRAVLLPLAAAGCQPSEEGSAAPSIQSKLTEAPAFAYRGPGNRDYPLDLADFEKGMHTEGLASHAGYVNRIEYGGAADYIRYSTPPGSEGEKGLGLEITERRAQDFKGAWKGYELVVFGMLRALSFKVKGQWQEDRMALRVLVDEIPCGTEDPAYRNIIVADVPSLSPGEVRVVTIAPEPRFRDAGLKALQAQIDRDPDVSRIKNGLLVNYPTCPKRIQFLWQFADGYTIVYPEWKLTITDLSMEVSNINVRRRWGGVIHWQAGFVSGDWIAMGRGGFELGGSGFLTMRWEAECCWEPWKPGIMDPVRATTLNGRLDYIASSPYIVTGHLSPAQFYDNPYFRLISPDSTHLGVVQFENREGLVSRPVGHYNFAISAASREEVLQNAKVIDPTISSLYIFEDR